MCIKENFPSLKHHAMNAFWIVRVMLHALFTSAIHGSERPVSCFGHFTPGERELHSYLIG
jgi:hypothetical protein